MSNTRLNHNAQTGVVADTYARALFPLARQADSVAAVTDDLASLAAIVAEQPRLAQLFAHRTIDRKRRAETIHRLFAGSVNDLTLRFLGVLNDKGRLDQIGSIAVAFDRLGKQDRNEVDADVYTATPLSAKQLQNVQAQLSEALGRTAIVHPRTDQALIGGLRVRFDDKLIDASVATQLRRLAQRLGERGHELARSGAASVLEED